MSSINQATSASKATFVTALVFNAAVFGIEIVAFTLLRPYFKAIYEPRTYAPPPSKRAQPLSPSFLGWPLAVFRADYVDIIKANGMDAYFFVRFLRMMVKVLLPIWIVSWAVLLPVTSVGTHVDNKDGLDQFSYGNVAADKQKRFAAHLICVWFFTFWIFYNIKQEMAHFIITRQKYLIEPDHAQSVQANTILITGIPAKYLTQDALLRVFNNLPGGVNRIWINRNLKELPDIYDRRLAACSKLESAETSLMSTAAKLKIKEAKSEGSPRSKTTDAQDPEDIERADRDVTIASAHDIVPRDKRPQHRLGSIPFFGKKVDTIEWCREEIAVCTRLLDEGRSKISVVDESGGAPQLDDPLAMDDGVDSADSNVAKRLGREATMVANDVKGAAHGAVGAVKGRVGGLISKGDPGVYPPMNSAFVTFNKQIAAHLAAQVLTHHEPYRMSGKYLEVAPEDVIWANLGMNPYEQKVRIAISYAATAALIIFWALPVAFVGIVSNVKTLCVKVVFLSWICKLPPVVVGIISGILPPVLLAVLMMLLPIVLRLLARFEGIPQRTGLELSLMTRFFIFQVVHSFLVVTLSSGIIASLSSLLSNPSSIPSILAENLPKASTFFLTYIILQGLAGTAGGFLQIVGLIIYYVKLFILGSTPRSIYGIKFGKSQVAWGTLFPNITLLVVITLGYSIISPIINGLACFTFFAFYLMYKYLFLWVYQQTRASDTGGLFFPKAIQHLFVGMYVQQVCLCALFFLARDQNNHASAIPEGALMIVLIVFTAGFNAVINNSYGPLIHALPLSLADKTYSARAIVEDEKAITSPASRSTEDSGNQRISNDQVSDEKAKLNQQGLEPLSLSQEEKKKREESYGFSHPAATRPQRTVWIPRDTLGISEEELRECREAGVDVSEQNAGMNEKGKVDISGGPPDLIE